MDTRKQVTVVSVHTPLIQFSATGGYYTSYAISLKSNNPCFTKTYSQIRRRYSEFLHLRHLLALHHPTISKPPALPPKNYFYRFSDAFIEERKNGLQTFLEKVLAIPVYLSDKSLHLFLQSSFSMSQIDEQCIGDIPVPQLLDDKPSNTSYHSDSSSSDSTEILSRKKEDRTFGNPHIGKAMSSKLDSNDCECEHSAVVKDPDSVSSLRNLGSSKPFSIPKRQGSLDSSPASSVSSLDNSYCSSLDLNRSRRVSFNEKVTVAVVCNQLWNIGVKSMRTDM